MPFELFKKKPELPSAPKLVVDIDIRFLRLENRAARKALDELEKSITYPVKADYSLKIEQLIEQGGYDEVKPYVNSNNFPSLNRESGWLPIKLIHFTEHVHKPYEVFAGLGLEAVDAQTLISLGNQYPDLQREFPIGAMGQPHQDFMKDIVVIFGNKTQRSVGYWASINQASDVLHYAVRPIWQSIHK